MRGYLLMGTRATDGGGRKNHGKPASPPTELGANKTSYASAKIGVEWISFAKQLAKLANLGILDHDGSLLGLRKEPHSEQTGERRREF